MVSVLALTLLASCSAFQPVQRARLVPATTLAASRTREASTKKQRTGSGDLSQALIDELTAEATRLDRKTAAKPEAFAELKAMARQVGQITRTQQYNLSPADRPPTDPANQNPSYPIEMQANTERHVATKQGFNRADGRVRERAFPANLTPIRVLPLDFQPHSPHPPHPLFCVLSGCFLDSCQRSSALFSSSSSGTIGKCGSSLASTPRPWLACRSACAGLRPSAVAWHSSRGMRMVHPRTS